MSYKYYGRLIGKLYNGLESLTGTSPANTTTPFNEQAPGTKFMAYGEDATSLAFNRAFGALATNIDSISNLLGSPALRSEILRAGSHDNPGFSTLAIEEFGQQRLALGKESGANTEPPVWVYCGFTKEGLARNSRIFHVDGRRPDGVHTNKANLDYRTTFTNYNLAPVDCAETAGGASIFQKVDGSEQLFSSIDNELVGMPMFIPPIRRIASDIVPYSGVPRLTTINFWDGDGMYVREETLGELCLRPGCFVEVQNQGDPDGNQGNNGLFRIEAIAHNTDSGITSNGSKVVLTRGNLHRVTVDDLAAYESGELVSWQSAPNHAEDSSGDIADGYADRFLRTNFAHIMYIIARPDLTPTAGDLYLASATGPDNFSYSGASGTASKIHAGAFHIRSVSSYGSVGLADQEEDADQNWALPIGTRLYNAASSHDPASGAEYATVRDVLPAGYPVAFTTLNTPGQFYPCTAPGFLLNPELEFGEALLPGNNYLWAKTLTTVGEQLMAPDGYISTASENAASEPYQTQQDVIATKVLLGHIHQGHSVVEGSDILNKPKSPTANILGPSLWKIGVRRIAGVETFGEAFGDLGVNFLTFADPDSTNFTVARPLVQTFDHALGTGTLILSDVSSLHSFVSDRSKRPLETGYIALVGTSGGVANTFEITSIDEAPYISDLGLNLSAAKGDAHDNKFVMDYGLNAAFHAQSSSSEYLRSRSEGYGNIIFVPGGTRDPLGLVSEVHKHRPFTTILEGEADFEVAHLTVSSRMSVGIAEVYEPNGDLTARIQHRQLFDDGALTFADKNTLNNPEAPAHGGDVPFSDIETSGNPDKVLHNLRDIPKPIRNKTILGALEALLPGGRSDSDVGLLSKGEHAYGSLSNGVFYGAEVLCKHDATLALGGTISRSYTNVEGGLWTGGDFDITIGEAYFNEFGAKNYDPGRTFDMSAFAESDVIIYWDTDNGFYGMYQASGAPDATGITTDDLLSNSRIPIAVVTVGATEVEAVVDIRRRICRQDQRDEIYVGRTIESAFAGADWNSIGVDEAMSFTQGSMHFATIGHAIKAIEKWNRYLPDGRSWTIKVVGPTHEVANQHRGIELPYKIPVDSLKIEGLGARTNTSLSMDQDGVSKPLITVWGYNGLFDLNSCSNLTFSNLSIRFENHPADVWMVDHSDTDPVVNVFQNSRSGLYEADLAAIGGAAMHGRINGGFYTSSPNTPLQENITIEGVHVTGPHHCFFWHGTRDGEIFREGAPEETASTHEDVPFDNLIIRDCVNEDGFMGFVILGPSNSEGSKRTICISDPQPYYWRNISITNCRSIATGAYSLVRHSVDVLTDSVVFDGIHLAACKEVVIRDCVISKHVKGITFGIGNSAHFCTGVIENNRLMSLYSDGITALSDADSSAIRIVGNHITSIGNEWNDPNGVSVGRTSTDATATFERFAGIRIGGNYIDVSKNFIEVDYGNPTDTHPLSPTVQSIFIDLCSGASSYFTGIKITDNTAKTDQMCFRFLTSRMELLDSLVVQGNVHTIELEEPWLDSGHYIHPVFQNYTRILDSYSHSCLDSFGIDIPFINNATITGNVLTGHIAIQTAESSSISNNQLKYEHTVVTVAGGSNFTFSDNNLDNGTLIFRGTSLIANGNNFCKWREDKNYLDIYKRADDFDKDRVMPGIYVTLEDSESNPNPYATISNNTLTSTPRDLVWNGIYNHAAEYKNLQSVISIQQADPDLLSRATVSGNIFTENGGIFIEAGTQVTVSGNEIDTGYDISASYPLDSIVVINRTSAIADQSLFGDNLANGFRRSNVNIANNNCRGNVRVNGCYEEFRNWNELVTAFTTGFRPHDGAGAAWPRNGLSWTEYPDGGDGHNNYYPGIAGKRAEYRHNKINNVSLTSNNIAGNIEFIGVIDSNVIDNRMIGSAEVSLDSESFQNYSQTRDLFNRGQIAMISCKRIQVSNCKFADLFIFRSSIIQCSDSIVGHKSSTFDDFGYYHALSAGTYCPTNQGRIFAAYSHNITIDSCQLSDASLDAEPYRHLNADGDNLNHPSYMNDFDAAVYSSAKRRTGLTSDSDVIHHIPMLYKELWAVGGISTHAMTVSNCRVSKAYFSGCDDLKLTGNRFYFGGMFPKIPQVVINENSIRPCIQNNHFTATLTVGDIVCYEGVPGKDENGNTWEARREKVVRHSVNAQITGNRFDSAVGSGLPEWSDSLGRPVGHRYGCGDIVMYNYGGSLISNNHMLKSPFGYMMHAGETENLLGRYPEYTIEQLDIVSRARKDSDNRIGGSIKLDHFNYYNPIYYTKGYVFGLGRTGAGYPEDDPSVVGDESTVAYYAIQIGTGRNNPSANDPWRSDKADAPMPWRVKWERGVEDDPYTTTAASKILEDISSASIANGGQDDYLEYLPWGGTWVYHWFSTAENMFRNASVNINVDGASDTTFRAAEHYPKTLGAFVVGNTCKNVVMHPGLRQSSWAFGRFCDIRPDVHGQPHLPAQAFETPLNPQHANNHTQFNMLRSMNEHLDLTVYGNFGSYVIKSNQKLDEAYGPERAESDRRYANAPGELYRKEVRFFLGEEAADYYYTRLSAPVRPSVDFKFDGPKTNMTGNDCNPFTEVLDQNALNGGSSSSGSSGGGRVGGFDGGCVLAGTLIQTERGSVAVEDITTGDRVRSWDFDEETFGYFDVVGLMEPSEQQRWVLVTTALGYELRCSDTHPLYTLDSEDNELPILEASIGDTVYVVDGDELIADTLASVEIIEEPTTVYNFEVDIVRSYISDGVLSHNKSTVGGGGDIEFELPDAGDYRRPITEDEDTAGGPDGDVTYAPSAISDV